MSQIKLLLDVIADVRHLGDSLQAYADALAKSELDSFEQIYPPPEETQPESAKTEPEPQSTEPETPAKTVTLVEVRAVLAEKSRAGYTDEVKMLLKKHGSEKLSGIDKSEYAALMEEAEKLGS